jgi:hypothetical protein
MNPKTEAADRSRGGPGSSHQDASEPQAPPKASAPEASAPQPGQPTNARRSRVSGGGGERDSHHSHNPREKS